MSVKSIPRKEKGLLDPRAMYIAKIEEFEENENWTHKDGVTAAYVGKLKIEGVAQGTSVEPFEKWMEKNLRLGFYIPGEEAKWYSFAAENFTAFCDAIGLDPEEFDPEDAVGKTLVIKVKAPEEVRSKVTRDDGTWTIADNREEISQYYPLSVLD